MRMGSERLLEWCRVSRSPEIGFVGNQSPWFLHIITHSSLLIHPQGILMMHCTSLMHILELYIVPLTIIQEKCVRETLKELKGLEYNLLKPMNKYPCIVLITPHSFQVTTKDKGLGFRYSLIPQWIVYNTGNHPKISISITQQNVMTSLQFWEGFFTQIMFKLCMCISHLTAKWTMHERSSWGSNLIGPRKLKVRLGLAYIKEVRGEGNVQFPRV